MSLRRRLILGLLALVGLGLLATDLATYGALRSFLDDRLSSELAQGVGQGYDFLARHPARVDATVLCTRVTADTYVVMLAPDGTQLFSCRAGSAPAPVIPSWLPGRASSAASPSPSGVGAVSFDTSAVGRGGTAYRAEALALSSGPIYVVAASLAPRDQTLAKLVTIEAVASGVVLAALVLLAWWVVRLGLRPLEDMAATAGEIARGDLARRVAPAGPETEVGRLGDALNAMLAQIEAAFAERRASENRLRRFVADASHELRTPLTSIRGYAELFRRGASADPEGLERAMGRIEGEAARMGVLVDDLLLLARLDQGRPLGCDQLDLSQLVTEAVDDARVVDPGRSISLAAEGGVSVTGDADRLRQVLANLLNNASAHTAPGTPVHVQVRADGDRAVLEVADEGDGLSPEQAAQVFERFYRADSARSRGGAGLGLSIVAAIAAAHGGRATVSSEPGRGATFQVEIPRLRGTTPAVTAPPGATEGERPAPGRAPAAPSGRP